MSAAPTHTSKPVGDRVAAGGKNKAAKPSATASANRTAASHTAWLAPDPPGAWTIWVQSGQAAAIEPVQAVYRLARRLGIEVIFITGRPERDREGTERNLRAIGCGDYAALWCKPDGAKETTGAFKAGVRARLAAEGRVIIANIGDQASDLAGGNAEKTFKLPNPFYLTK